MKRRILALAVLGLVGWSAPLRADYKESYRKGIAAVDKGDWREAERWMQQAVNDKSQEGESIKLYGVRFEPYLPHYFLGLARFERRNCEGALAQWQESEKQGQVQGTAHFKTLARNRDLCTQQVALKPSSAPTATPPTHVEPPAAPAPAPQPVVAEPQKAAEVPAPAPRHEETPAPAAPARPDAGQEEARRQELRLQVDRAAADGRKILDKASRAPHPAADLKRQQKALRALLRKSGELGPTTPIADLEGLQKDIPAASLRLEALLSDPSGPPAELRAAARAFLRGDYPAVISTLAAVRFQERRAVLTRSLLLAAARYSLYLAAGEKDAKLRQQVVDDVLACRRLDPALAPDAELFSPRFREFFRTAG